MNNIRIILGDITAAGEDAIVNAANPRMLGGGGVDRAIHRAAGPKLLEECKKVKAVNGRRCPIGESRITPAGSLKSKFVIHTVGPKYRNESNPEEVLKSAYTSACKLAVENGCKSIAFPAISCGVYGYPHQEAAEIALKACGEAKFHDLKINFYIWKQSFFDIFCATYEQHMKDCPSRYVSFLTVINLVYCFDQFLRVWIVLPELHPQPLEKDRRSFQEPRPRKEIYLHSLPSR